MDSDIYRICVDAVRPNMADRAQGKIPPGLYLRDISEVREGSDSFQFMKNSIQPKEPDNCLSLVGSERTISLELPSKFTRDWFLARFRLLAEDILVEQEKRMRKYKLWENSKHLSQIELSGVDHLKTLLEGGIQVMHHQRSTGKIEQAVLKFDTQSNTLELKSLKAPGWFSSSENAKLNVYDVSEIRPGSHSFGFVKTGSTEFDMENLSIVGTETVLDLQLINNTARDLFAERFFNFVLSYIVTRKGPNDQNTSIYDINKALQVE